MAESPTPSCYRIARADDADRVANLHAASWRRHYRGAYADSFLDGDVVAERREVWSRRLTAATGSITVLAEHGDSLAGFVHIIFDEDQTWGSFIDNLHVAGGRQRNGIGTGLLARAAAGTSELATIPGAYLWVLEQNAAAQRFYRACGGTAMGTAPVAPPGGLKSRLNGSPVGVRIVWPDVAVLASLRP